MLTSNLADACSDSIIWGPDGGAWPQVRHEHGVPVLRYRDDRVCSEPGDVLAHRGESGSRSERHSSAQCLQMLMKQLGGGGLLTVSSVVVTDLVPLRDRGIYQGGPEPGG